MLLSRGLKPFFALLASTGRQLTFVDVNRAANDRVLRGTAAIYLGPAKRGGDCQCVSARIIMSTLQRCAR